MCYEYTNWAWKARAAELAKRKLSEPQEKPARPEEHPEPAAETSPKERDTVPA